MKIGSDVDPLFLRLDLLACTALIVATLSISTAQAGPFEFSDVELQVRSELASPRTVDQKSDFVPETSTKTLKSLIEISGEPFGKHLDRGPFASAVTSGAHAGGVGVAGFFFRPNVVLTAETFFRQSITNVDTVAHRSNFIYDIEPIDVAVLGGDSEGHQGEFAGIEIIATAEYFDSAGFSLGSDFLVNYLLQITNKDFFIAIDTSDEFDEDAGLGEDIPGFLGGLHYDGFSNSRRLRTLEPGETAIVEYDWLARLGTTGFRETGAEAFIGDPFDLTGTGGGFSFVVDDGVPLPPPPPPPVGAVPEPGTLGILGLGLALYGVASRRLQKLGDLE